MPDTVILVNLFEIISTSEPWATSQRWRALVASNIAKTLRPSMWEDHVTNATQEIIYCLAWAYCVPMTQFQPLSASIQKELTAIYRDAHELSVVIKRDILSVRISVTGSSEPSAGFDPRMTESVWPEMGAKQGDDVLGDYSLGLMKRTETGEISFPTRPKVLLRWYCTAMFIENIIA